MPGGAFVFLLFFVVAAVVVFTIVKRTKEICVIEGELVRP